MTSSIKYHNLIVICCAILFQLIASSGIEDLQMTYQQFKEKYSKQKLAPTQQSRRELIFYSNLQKLKTMLEEGCQFCGVTVFYDETSEEFRGRMGLLPEQHSEFDAKKYAKIENGDDQSPIKVQSQKSDLIKVSAEIPASKNWASEGKITSIKNQGSCGTCWSFAVAAAIQSSLILKGQARNFIFFDEPDLSQQFLLTCADQGTCKGGYIQETIDLAYQKGVPYETYMPYVAYKSSRAICSQTKNNYRFTDEDTGRFSYYNVADSQIIQLLQKGPLAIAISADNWQNYGGGTFKCPSTAQVNHAVLLVGYDSNRWIIKNQWGTNWGQKGYIYVSRNRLNNCKIGFAIHKLWNSSLSVSALLLLIILSFLS